MLTLKAHLIHIILISSILQLIFIAFIIFAHKTSNKYFAAILIVLSLFTSSSLVITFLSLGMFHPVREILNQSYFLPGPILYLYFKTFFLNKKIHFKHILHIIPFILFTLAAIFLPDFVSIWPDYPYFSMFSAGFAIIIHIPYFVLVLKLFQKDFIEKNKKLYFWLNFYIYGLFFIWICKCIAIIIWNVFRLFWLEFYAYDQIIYPIITGYFIFTALYIYIIIYTVFSQKNLYLKNLKYKHSPLDDKMKSEYKIKLENYMATEKKYLDPDLNLKKLKDKEFEYVITKKNIHAFFSLLLHCWHIY